MPRKTKKTTSKKNKTYFVHVDVLKFDFHDNLKNVVSDFCDGDELVELAVVGRYKIVEGEKKAEKIS